MFDPITGQPKDSFTTNLAVCYEVLLYLAGRMARLEPGEVLEFVTGDPEAAEKVPEWCELRGYILLESSIVSDGQRRFLIQK